MQVYSHYVNEKAKPNILIRSTVIYNEYSAHSICIHMYACYQSLSIRLIKQTVFLFVEIDIKLNGHIWCSKNI